MNNQFDELTKGLAQSVTRRAALKKFGVGLAGMALACFGLANKAAAAPRQGYCQIGGPQFITEVFYTGMCMDINGCVTGYSADCPANGTPAGSVAGKRIRQFQQACSWLYKPHAKCSFTL